MQHELILILKLRKFITLSIILVCTIFSSSCQKQTATSFETLNEDSQIKEIPKDWQKIETDEFSFSIPRTMKKNDVHGIDSFVMQFENDEITLDIEYGDYSADLIPLLRDYEGQKEQTIIDGEKTDIVGYDRNKPLNLSNRMVNSDSSTNFIEPNKNYIFGVNFPHKNEIIAPEDRPAISFVVRCKNLENKETAKTIIYSIKFK